MIIKSVELNNIRSYKTEVIEFTEGINFLSGDIGSGKSTILLAIEFALFGFKKGDLEGFQVLRKGEKEGFVKLNLIDSKNNEIEIFRKIKSSKTSSAISQENGYVKIDNNIQELSPQELNAYIFDILNFPKEFLTKDKNLVYRFTIYTPQEQLKEVLFASSEKRLEVIRKIFGIDKYKQLLDASSYYLSDLKTEKKIFDSKLDGDDKIKLEYESLEKEIKEITKKNQNLLEKEKPFKEKVLRVKDAIDKRDLVLEKLSKNKIFIEKNISVINEVKKNISNYEREQLEIDNKIKILQLTDFDKSKLKFEENIKEVELKNKSILEKKKEFKEIEKEVEKLNESKDKINSKISELSSLKEILENSQKSFDYTLTKCQLKDCEVEIAKVKLSLKKAEKIKTKNEELKENLTKSQTNFDSLKIQIDEKEEFIKNFKSLKSCPTCMQEVDCNHNDKVSKNQNEELKKLVDKRSDLRIDIKNFKDEIKISQKQLEELNSFEKKLIELIEKEKFLSEKEKREKEETKKQKEVINKISILEKEKLIDELNKIELKNKEIKDKKLELDKLNEEERKNLDQINEIKLNLSKLESQIKELETLKKSKDDLIKKITESKSKLEKEDEFKSKLIELDTKEKEIKERKLELKKMQETLFEKEKILTSKLSQYKVEIESKTRELNEKKEKLESLEKIKKDLITLLKREDFISSKVSTILQSIEKAVFTKYYVEFNEIFENLFKDLIEDNEIDVRLDELFSIIVEQNGFDIDIKNLSGGEKSSLAIAYRLGLKKIIESNLNNSQKLSLLILDEPTDGFSNEQIDRLGNILKESELEQTILVSHDNKISSIADSTINIEKTNHVSKIE